MVQKDQQGDWRSGRKYELRNIYNLRIYFKLCGKAWNAGRFIGFYRWWCRIYIYINLLLHQTEINIPSAKNI